MHESVARVGQSMQRTPTAMRHCASLASIYLGKNQPRYSPTKKFFHGVACIVSVEAWP